MKTLADLYVRMRVLAGAWNGESNDYRNGNHICFSERGALREAKPPQNSCPDWPPTLLPLHRNDRLR